MKNSSNMKNNSNMKNIKTKKKGKKKEKNNKTIKNYKNNKNYKKLNCSPNLSKDDKNNFSCYSNTNIIKLKNLWNKYYPDKKILEKDPYLIWKKLKENFSNSCDKESCWLRQNFLNNDKSISNELFSSFLPPIPESWKKNSKEWLSNIDINNVLMKYEKAYKCFEFIGPSSIDFKYKYNSNNCVCNKLCNFSLNEKIKNKKTKIGIIFNLDPHYKSGSHWVSLFINITKKLIFYFDSGGDKIPNEIMELVNTIIKQGNNLKPPIYFTFDQNYPNEHQYENTECGVYSLYFIINMLKETKTGNFFKTKKIKDDKIHKYRRKFFNYDI